MYILTKSTLFTRKQNKSKLYAKITKKSLKKYTGDLNEEYLNGHVRMEITI